MGNRTLQPGGQGSLWVVRTSTVLDVCFAPATVLATEIREGGLSPVDVVDAYLDRIEHRYDNVNAYITVTEE